MRSLGKRAQYHPAIARALGRHGIISYRLGAPAAEWLQAVGRHAPLPEVGTDCLRPALRELAIEYRVALVVSVPLYFQA
jgi:hypothetical protein